MIQKICKTLALVAVFAASPAFALNVVLNKAADAKRLAGIVKTERLNVDTEAQYAHTDSPVTFQYGQSGGQANGMTYDHKTGLLNFPSKVKATIYDTKNL